LIRSVPAVLRGSLQTCHPVILTQAEGRRGNTREAMPMPIVAEQYRFVAGVDTHARRHSLAIIETASGRQVDAADFPATAAGYACAGSWLMRRGGDPRGVLVSMEGTGSFGAKLR